MGIFKRNVQGSGPEIKTLYIASDSPTSQYRNKNNVFLTKKWAVENNIDVHWIFTEAGHGKGPMDGVGSTIKREIKDTIAFHPNTVIVASEASDLIFKIVIFHDVPSRSSSLYTGFSRNFWGRRWRWR